MAVVLSALATVADLSGRLGIDAPAIDSAAYIQMESFLEDASGDLRGVTGQALNFGDSTVSLRVGLGGKVALPSVPAVSITSVVDADGVAVEFEQEDTTSLQVLSPAAKVTVTYSHGWQQIPGEIVKWTCVIAAASLAAAKSGNLGLSGGLAAVSVDDARAAWATKVGEQGEGITVPESVAERLRATYGAPMLTVEYR